MSLSYVGLSKCTKLFVFSFTLPFDHFFFLPLDEAWAAAALASFDFCGAGGMVSGALQCHAISPC